MDAVTIPHQSQPMAVCITAILHNLVYSRWEASTCVCSMFRHVCGFVCNPIIPRPCGSRESGLGMRLVCMLMYTLQCVCVCGWGEHVCECDVYAW